MNANNGKEVICHVGASAERVSTLPSGLNMVSYLRSIVLSFATLASSASVETQGATLVTHYDVSSTASVANGTTVAQFVDISGNNNHAMGSGGTYLFNGICGLPSLRFTPNNLDDGFQHDGIL